MIAASRFIFFLLLTFLFIFGPVMNSIGAWADFIFITSFFLCAYNVVLLKYPLQRYMAVFFVLIPLFLYAVLTAPLTFNIAVSEVATLLLKPFRILVTLMGGFVLVKLIQRTYKEKFFGCMIDFVFYSIVLHAAIMVIQFFNVDFKDYVYSYTTTGDFRSDFEYHFRMGGLSGATGGSILSIVQSIGVVLIPFLSKKGLGKKIIVFLGGALIIGSILVCGRSGILVIIVFLPIAYISLHSLTKVRNLVRFSTIIAVVFVAITTIIIAIKSLPDDDALNIALNRSLDSYINFQESGELKSEATTELFEQHLKLPPDLRTFMLGNSEHLINFGFDRKLNSDIGYVRDFWSFGIFGALIYLLPFISVFIIVIWKKRNSHAAKILMILSLIFFMFNAKETFLYVRMMWSIYSLVLACFYIGERMKNITSAGKLQAAY